MDDWRNEAACFGLVWFADDKNLAEAKKICATCPVRKQCLKFGFSEKGLESPGIYGGYSTLERTGKICEQCDALEYPARYFRGLCWTCYTRESRLRNRGS